MSPIAYWPLIEASLQIVAACLTMLRPFVENWRLIFWTDAAPRGTGYRKSITLGSGGSHHLSAAEDGAIYKTSDVQVEIQRRGTGEKGRELEDGLEIELRGLR